MNPIGTASFAGCLRFLTCALMAAACSACTPIFSEEPAGDSPAKLDIFGGATSFWEGTWMPDGIKDDRDDKGYARPVTLTVRDAEHGTLEAAWIELAGGKPAIRKETVFVRRAGPWLLASVPYSAFFVPGPPSAGKTLYAWARVDLINEDLMAISVPQGAAFRDYLVKQEQAGANKDLIVAARIGMELLGRLQPGDMAWRRPVILRRLPVPEKYPFTEPAPPR